MSSRFNLEYFDPPPALERYVLALFHFVWDEPFIADRHPGALPHLALFPYGSGDIRFGDRVDRVDGEMHLLSGFTAAVPFTMNGPWHAVGASLSPLGWAAITGEPANKWLDRFMTGREVFGAGAENFAAQTNALYRAGTLSGRDACDSLANWLARQVRHIVPAHQQVIKETADWLGTALNPEMDELYSRLSYSRRQAERIVERYFGFPPAALARKHRAVRSAEMLARPTLTDSEEAEIADAFYDQPHMIREIRRFCGYTPSRLGGPGDPLFQTMLRMKNFERLQHLREQAEAA